MSPRPSSIASAFLPASAWITSRALAAGFATFALLLAGCQAGPARPTSPSAATPDLSAYRLGIGDRVRVSVFGEPDLSVDSDVDATGHLSYPLLGRVPALRKTADELAASIATGLANGYLVNPDVSPGTGSRTLSPSVSAGTLGGRAIVAIATTGRVGDRAMLGVGVGHGDGDLLRVVGRQAARRGLLFASRGHRTRRLWVWGHASGIGDGGFMRRSRAEQIGVWKGVREPGLVVPGGAKRPNTVSAVGP